MNGAEISTFVNRLEFGRVKSEEFRELTIAEWNEVKKLLEARRHFHMQKYINGICILRIKADPAWEVGKRTYTEDEILEEFGDLQ